MLPFLGRQGGKKTPTGSHSALISKKVGEQTSELNLRNKIIEDLKMSLELLIRKYNELKTKYDSTVEEESKEKELVQNLEETKEKLAEKENKLDKAELLVSRLQRDLAVKTESVKMLEEKIKWFTEPVVDAKQLDKIKEEAEIKLQKLRVELETELDCKEKIISELNLNLISVKQERDLAKKELDDVENKRKETENQQKNREKELENKIKDLENLLEEKGKEAALNSSSRRQLEIKVSQLEKAAKMALVWENKANEIEIKLAETEKISKEIENKARFNSENRVSELGKELKEAQKKIKELEKRLKDTEKKVKEGDTIDRKLRENNKKLRETERKLGETELKLRENIENSSETSKKLLQLEQKLRLIHENELKVKKQGKEAESKLLKQNEIQIKNLKTELKSKDVLIAKLRGKEVEVAKLKVGLREEISLRMTQILKMEHSIQSKLQKNEDKILKLTETVPKIRRIRVKRKSTTNMKFINSINELENKVEALTQELKEKEAKIAELKHKKEMTSQALLYHQKERDKTEKSYNELANSFKEREKAVEDKYFHLIRDLEEKLAKLERIVDS